MSGERKKRHKVLFGLLLGLMVPFVLGGCGKNQNETEKPVINLTYAWWGNDNRHQYTMDAIDLYEDAMKGKQKIECKYGSWKGQENRMRIYMKSKDTPDVMLINYNWIDEYSPDGYGFFDLMLLNSIIDISQYSDADLRYGMKNGKLNAIPIAMNAQTLYYNQDIFEQYGLEIPTTWDDFFKAATVMREDGIYPLSMTKKAMFLFVLAHQVQRNKEELTFEDGMVVLSKKDISDMLKFYRNLIDEKVLLPIDNFSRNEFTNGKVAGTMAWISDAGNYCQALADQGVNVVVGDYPRFPDSPVLGWYEKPATMYAISTVTEYPREAAMLLNYLINSEEMALLQKTEKGIPVSAKAKQVLIDHNLMAGFEVAADEKRQAASEEIGLLNPILESDTVIDTFKKEADYYLYDKASLEEVVDKIYYHLYPVEEEEESK